MFNETVSISLDQKKMKMFIFLAEDYYNKKGRNLIRNSTGKIDKDNVSAQIM